MKSDIQVLKEVDKDLKRALTILSDHQFRVAVRQAHEKVTEHLSK